MNRWHKFYLATLVCLTIYAFQNCGIQPQESSNGQGSLQLIDDVDNYEKIDYTDAISGLYNAANSEVSLDLQNGAISIDSKGISDCQLDADRLAALSAIIGDGSICKPGPLPPETVSCMAMSVIQTQLSGAAGELPLYAEVCNNGIYLCNGNLPQLQSYLNDLLANPPAYCN